MNSLNIENQSKGSSREACKEEYEGKRRQGQRDRKEEGKRQDKINQAQTKHSSACERYTEFNEYRKPEQRKLKRGMQGRV